MLSTKLTVTGDQKLLRRMAENVKRSRVLMQRVGVLGMSSSVKRLQSVLRPDRQSLRSGMLAKSISVDRSGGGGNEHTVFQVSDRSVTVGSNMPYAAQVNYGGTILPKEAKALAIPLIPRLAKNRISPRDLPEGRDALRFQPVKSGKPNVIGLLILEPGRDLLLSKTNAEGKQDRIKGKKRKGIAAYLLVSSVTQEARPFMYWSDEDVRTIEQELLPQWLGGK